MPQRRSISCRLLLTWRLISLTCRRLGCSPQGVKLRTLMPCTLGMSSPAGCPERSCRGSCRRPGQPKGTGSIRGIRRSRGTWPRSSYLLLMKKITLSMYIKHRIHPFYVYNLVSFNKLVQLCNHDCNLALESFYDHLKLSCAHLQSIPVPTGVLFL